MVLEVAVSPLLRILIAMFASSILTSTTASYAVEIPKPIINIPKPNIPRPTISVPRPNVTVNVPKPAVNVPKSTVSIPKPAVSVPKPAVTVPAPKTAANPAKIDTPKTAITVAPLKVDHPHHTVDLPKTEPPKTAAEPPKPPGIHEGGSTKSAVLPKEIGHAIVEGKYPRDGKPVTPSSASTAVVEGPTKGGPVKNRSKDEAISEKNQLTIEKNNDSNSMRPSGTAINEGATSGSSAQSSNSKPAGTAIAPMAANPGQPGTKNGGLKTTKNASSSNLTEPTGDPCAGQKLCDGVDLNSGKSFYYTGDQRSGPNSQPCSGNTCKVGDILYMRNSDDTTFSTYKFVGCNADGQCFQRVTIDSSPTQTNLSMPSEVQTNPSIPSGAVNSWQPGQSVPHSADMSSSPAGSGAGNPLSTIGNIILPQANADDGSRASPQEMSNYDKQRLMNLSKSIDPNTLDADGQKALQKLNSMNPVAPSSTSASAPPTSDGSLDDATKAQFQKALDDGLNQIGQKYTDMKQQQDQSDANAAADARRQQLNSTCPSGGCQGVADQSKPTKDWSDDGVMKMKQDLVNNTNNESKASGAGVTAYIDPASGGVAAQDASGKRSWLVPPDPQASRK
jgi:hypothetical protein